MLELVIAIIGLAIAVVTLIFTNQGREIIDNVWYHIRKLIRLGRRLIKRNILPNAPLESGDKSAFVSDITIPDGTKVAVDQSFIKIWEIRNVGTVAWGNRYLQRQGSTDGPGRLKSPLRIKIPYTRPGQSRQIKVKLTAPPLPGSCYAEWKMVDRDGRLLLPNQKAVYVAIDVVEKS